MSIKQLLCRHDYKPWANVYGDLRNYIGGTTMLLCPKCSKKKVIDKYIEAPLNYNMIGVYYYHKMSGTLTDDLEKHLFYNIVQDWEQYLENFQNYKKSK